MKVLKRKTSFKALVKLMDTLRGPKGCPWDKVQTHKSLLPYLHEEALEVEKAVKKKDFENLKDELGDLLLQVIFHSQIAKENGFFDISDVIDILSRKLRRRHPHVFGNMNLNTPKEVVTNWERIKRMEKRSPARRRRALNSERFQSRITPR